MRTRKVWSEAGLRESIYRFAVEIAGLLTAAYEGPRTRLDPPRCVTGTRLRHLDQSLDGFEREHVVTGTRRCLDELGQCPHRVPGIEGIVGSAAGCRHRVRVAAEAVVEHGRSPVRPLGDVSAPVALGCLDRALNRLGSFGLDPSERAKAQRRPLGK